MLRENETISWHPEHIKHGRFGDWLENNVDWALSRDRFWGTPIPVWRCRDCGHDTCVGSVAELSELAGAPLDRSRPAPPVRRRRRDRLPGVRRRARAGGSSRCSTRGSTRARCRPRRSTTRSRTRTQLDARFPADFICEAIDQTRGWFYSLLAVNTLVFDRAPYRNVVCLALLLDEDGQKMSKSRGQRHGPVERARRPRRRRAALELRVGELAVDAQAGVAREHRRDDEPLPAHALEHLLVLLDLREPRRLDAGRGAGRGRRPRARPLDPLAAALDGRARSATRSSASTRCAARRRSSGSSTISRTGTCAGRARASGTRRTPTRTRCCTSACCSITQLLAPFCPFISDALYQDLAQTTESVHLSDWPAFDAAAIDATLESDMALARQVVSLGLAARTEVRLKVRQPLARALVLLPGGAVDPRVGAGRDRGRAEREAARDGDEPRGSARLLGRAELPSRSARRSASSCRR